VDFSEARDLFVNIFRILDLTAKIVDHGLISERSRGLSANSAKSLPRVDFTKVQGLFAKFSNNSARVSPELGRRCGGRATMVQNGEAVALGERAAQAGREGNRSGERCSEARGGCSPFIGGRGSAGKGWSGVNRRR
jgi:hypothetical protein